MNPFVALVLLLVAESQVGLAVNVLVGTKPYSIMNPNEYLNQSGYYLLMQPDCNLVLYNSALKAIRDTNSSRPNLNCSLAMQDDGNLVIYNFTGYFPAKSNASNAIWAQNYFPGADGNGSFLLLGADGSLEFYNTNSNGFLIDSTFNWFPSDGKSYPNFNPSSSVYKAWRPDSSLSEFPYMPAGYFLDAGKRLVATSGIFSLMLGNDCNLQSMQNIYDGTEKVLWDSSTGSGENRNCTLSLGQNGSLVLSDQAQVYWNSNKSGDINISWIFKLDPDDGTLSVSDITNTSNILWTNIDVSPPPTPESGRPSQPIVWIVGVLAGVLVLAVAAFGINFYARRNFLDPAEKAFQARLRATGGNSQAFSETKIKQATKNYENVIGRGGFGGVFNFIGCFSYVSVLAGVLVLAVAAFGINFYARRNFLDPAEKAFQARFRATGGNSQAFSETKIKQATKNYENVIGRGGFGGVFNFIGCFSYVSVLAGVLVLAVAAFGINFYARRNFLDPAEKAFQARLRATGGNSQAFSETKIKQATKNYENVIGRGGFGGVFNFIGCFSYVSFLDPAEKAFQAKLRAIGGNSQAFSETKIKQATKNYENVIGRGGFGDVFYGKLPDGQELAAKVLSATSHQSKNEFFNKAFLGSGAMGVQIELLSKVHHKYLVSLLGYSCTSRHQILIYEYMAGGDLRHRLQGETGAANPLSWRQRTSIILQVAEGLEYLHDKCSPPVIHRDIKSTNILLTNKLVAKVADFGLSKLKTIGQEDATHITTVVKGTPGYLDPEYHETGLLTEKSDVYAFGVVLMEILTGRHPMYIAQRVGEAWRQEQVHNLADPNLEKDFDSQELVNLVELVLWCVRRNSMERPFMRQVVGRLHDLRLASSEPHQPEIELGDEEDEAAQRNAKNIEMVMMDSEMVPLSDSGTKC